MSEIQTQVVTDPGAAKRVMALVESRRSVAKAHDAFNVWDGDGFNGQYGTFMLLGASNAVKVTAAWANQHTLTFVNEDEPAYRVFINGDGNVGVEFAGDNADCPSLDAQLTLAESLAVGPNELVPYGFATNGLITVLLNVGDVQDITVQGVAGYYLGLDCFVLEGELFPAELRMPWPLSDADLAPWLDNFWHLVKYGVVVRLTERINHLPAEMWSVCDAKHNPWLEFDASDGYTPILFVGSRYMHWHPTETRPGERINEPRTSTPARYPLRGWYR